MQVLDVTEEDEVHDNVGPTHNVPAGDKELPTLRPPGKGTYETSPRPSKLWSRYNQAKPSTKGEALRQRPGQQGRWPAGLACSVTTVLGSDKVSINHTVICLLGRRPSIRWKPIYLKSI